MIELKSSISLLSVNARGLRDLTKRKSLFLFCKGKKAQFIFLQETHSKDEDSTFWSQQWGDKTYFSHGTSKSAGVAILLQKFSGQILHNIADEHGHWLILIVTIDHIKIILVNVYGFNNISENKRLLHELTLHIEDLKVSQSTDNIIIGGDLNLVNDDFLDRFPSRYMSSHPNIIFNSFCWGLSLTDAWRYHNPTATQFSWFSSNYNSKSRIDNWLISNNLLCYDIDSNISAAPLTDHSVIFLRIKSRHKSFTNKFWKFNASLLKNDDYCQMIKSLINEIKSSEELKTPVKKWEFLKFKTREASISFSKRLKKELDQKEFNIINQMNTLCRKQMMSDDDKQTILKLQSTLDEMYTYKTQGAFIRSRAKWIEEGEKNSAYFCGLEKNRQEKNNIKSLLVNNKEITDDKLILIETYKFYSKLYSSKFSKTDCESFLENIAQYIPKIDDNYRDVCDDPLTITELDAVIGRLAPNKSPGSDGLTGNFYKHFWMDIKELLYNVFLEILETGSLPTTMRHGIIISIPKPNKDPRVVDNRRPITLRNSDYKLLTYIFALRLQSGLSSIIAESQSGFMKGRSIHNNIRLVMDLIEYSDLIQDNGFIFFLDFYKAFDSVEHPFILAVLEHFGFGLKFRKLISGLYENINSCVLLSKGSTPSFNVDVGIPQGCPISPYLFLLVTEILSIYIKKSDDIQKLNVFGTEIVISQLADDTTLFLKNEQQIPKAIEKIEKFSKASGLHLNLKKCEIFSLHDTTLKEICNIPVKSEIKYLGIQLGKDKYTCQKNNIETKQKESKTKLNIWLQRDLSIFGRIYLTKMESLSRCIYPLYSNAASPNLIKLINQLNFNFIWRNKPHYIRKGHMIKDTSEGGLKMIDLDCLNGTLKINWLKSWIKNYNSLWYCIPNFMFKKLGGLNLLLVCDFDIKKLPISLSEFHKQILLYWKMLYVHNFSPHLSVIWNNRYILHRNKSLFYEDWYENNIWSILHLMDDEGNLLNYEQFCTKHNFNPSFLDFIRLRNALPKEFIFLSKNFLAHQKAQPRLPIPMIHGISIVDKKCCNSFIRKCLTDELFPGLQNKNDILFKFNKSTVSKLRTMYLSFPIAPKIKETHFKIMNDIYPSKELLRLRFNVQDNSCTFCNTDIETTDHLFFSCCMVQMFWTQLQNWLKEIFPSSMYHFTRDDITFGVLVNNKKEELCINVILCIAKFCIHKRKCQKYPPNFSVFKNELKLYIKSLKCMKRPNAVKLHSYLCDISLDSNEQ